MSVIAAAADVSAAAKVRFAAMVGDDKSAVALRRAIYNNDFSAGTPLTGLHNVATYQAQQGRVFKPPAGQHDLLVRLRPPMTLAQSQLLNGAMYPDLVAVAAAAATTAAATNAISSAHSTATTTISSAHTAISSATTPTISSATTPTTPSAPTATPTISSTNKSTAPLPLLNGCRMRELRVGVLSVEHRRVDQRNQPKPAAAGGAQKWHKKGSAEALMAEEQRLKQQQLQGDQLWVIGTGIGSESIALQLSGFEPSLLVVLDESEHEWSQQECDDWQLMMNRAIGSQWGRDCSELEASRVRRYISRVECERRTPRIGFTWDSAHQRQREDSVLRVYGQSLTAMQTVRRQLQIQGWRVVQDRWPAAQQFIHRTFQQRSHERRFDEADYDSAVRVGRWLSVPVSALQETTVAAARQTTCQLEFQVDWQHVRRCRAMDAVPIPYLTMSFDIECFSYEGYERRLKKFPNANFARDAIVCISNVLEVNGRSAAGPFLRVSFQLRGSSPVPNTIVYFYDTESEMLLAWLHFMTINNDIDNTCGYNSQLFDMVYMATRAVKVCGQPRFAHLGRFRADAARMPWEPRFKGNGDGDADGDGSKKEAAAAREYPLQIAGRWQVDLRMVLAKMYPTLDDYRLKTVCAKLLKSGVNKVDLDVTEIGPMFMDGTPDDMADVAFYCMIDSLMCSELERAQNLSTFCVELAAQTNATVDDVVKGGEQVRVLGCILQDMHLYQWYDNPYALDETPDDPWCTDLVPYDWDGYSECNHLHRFLADKRDRGEIEPDLGFQQGDPRANRRDAMWRSVLRHNFSQRQPTTTQPPPQESAAATTTAAVGSMAVAGSTTTTTPPQQQPPTTAAAAKLVAEDDPEFQRFCQLIMYSGAGATGGDAKSITAKRKAEEMANSAKRQRTLTSMMVMPPPPTAADADADADVDVDAGRRVEDEEVEGVANGDDDDVREEGEDFVGSDDDDGCGHHDADDGAAMDMYGDDDDDAGGGANSNPKRRRGNVQQQQQQNPAKKRQRTDSSGGDTSAVSALPRFSFSSPPPPPTTPSTTTAGGAGAAAAAGGAAAAAGAGAGGAAAAGGAGAGAAAGAGGTSKSGGQRLLFAVQSSTNYADFVRLAGEPHRNRNVDLPLGHPDRGRRWWPGDSTNAFERTDAGMVFRCLRAHYPKEMRRHIFLLDFASLYPSVIMADDVCYSMWIRQRRYLDAGRQDGIRTRRICHRARFYHQAVANPDKLSALEHAERLEKGLPLPAPRLRTILPRILDRMVNKRREVRAQGAALKKQGRAYEAAVYHCKQLALKQLCNASYGFLNVGGRMAVMPCPPLAYHICSSGRDQIRIVKYLAERRVDGHEHGRGVVVYGDTDSVMVTFPDLQFERSGDADDGSDATFRAAVAAGTAQCDRIIRDCAALFLAPHDLENESMMESAVFCTKKMYTAWLPLEKDESDRTMIKGLECKKRSYCNGLRKMLKLVQNDVLHGRYRAAEQQGRDWALRLARGQLEYQELARTIGYNAATTERALIEPCTFKKTMRRLGCSFGRGDRIPMVIRNKQSPREKYMMQGEEMEYAEKQQMDIDVMWYYDAMVEPLRKLLAYTCDTRAYFADLGQQVRNECQRRMKSKFLQRFSATVAAAVQLQQ